MRKISLYIGNTEADLSDESFILFNYTMEDLLDPAAIKNTYSQQITLPGTPTNHGIFGHFYRTDRVTTANDFNAGRKTAFCIMSEDGQIIESGYVRLDSIEQTSSEVISYKVSLFGGLGSFFYALSYDDAGNKRSLASLDYLGGGSEELTFKINTANVSAAWARIDTHDPDDGPSNLWDVLNFAPAYNGIPSGDFSADKAIAEASVVGLPASQTEGGTTYSTQSGNVLVNLAQAHDEWACKDLRSYLQRPVLSMRAFLDALEDSANNGGYDFTVDPSIKTQLGYVWKTLPMLSHIGTLRRQETDESITIPATFSTSGDDTPKLTLTGVNVNDTVTTSPTLEVRVKATTNPVYDSLSSEETISEQRGTFFFAQLVAYSSDDVVLGGSPVAAVTPNMTKIGAMVVSELASLANYVPLVDNFDGRKVVPSSGMSGSGIPGYLVAELENMTVEVVGVSYYRLHVTQYGCAYYPQSGNVEVQSNGGSGMNILFFDADGLPSQTPRPSAGMRVTTSSGELDYHITSPTAARSGATIRKADILQSEHTPAEYLISLAKMYGCVFLYDRATRAVTMKPRNAFYDGEVVDLTERVDISKQATITPQLFAAKWYDFKLEMAEGAFAKEYKAKYGIDFGLKRVDTAYDFDSAVQDILSGNAFRTAVTILDNNQYWCRIIRSTSRIPSVFLDAGNTATYYATGGATHEFQVSQPLASDSVYFYNSVEDYYDDEFSPKLELRDAANAEADGEDILCFFRPSEGYGIYTGFKLSDDTAAMLAMNAGKPCWDITPASGGVYIPSFSHYFPYLGSLTWGFMSQSLDYGTPKEYEFPFAVLFFNDATGDQWTGTMYERFWQAYIRDRYDKDTKVLRCRVRLDGMQVGQELLRHFYFFDGSLWTLNKIINHSLTTDDATECEFIQIQDKANYTQGQTW